jgi:hypothetical protein
MYIKELSTIGLNEQQLTFKLTNQGWFKILAFVSFLCFIFTWAVFIWLLVCRANRLPETDESIKEKTFLKEKLKSSRKHKIKKRKLNMKKKLRYLIFGNLKVNSPESSCIYDNENGKDSPSSLSSDDSPPTSSIRIHKRKNSKINKLNEKIETINETDKLKSKSKNK